MNQCLRRESLLRIGVAAIVAPGFVRTAGSAAAYDYKHGHEYPASHFLNLRTMQLWDAVRRETNGRLSVQVFPNSALGNTPSTMEQVRVGAIQFLTMSNTGWSSVIQIAAIDGIGFAFKSGSDAAAVMDGPLGNFVRRQYESKGLYVFDKFWDTGMKQIASATHPITRAEDFANFKIGVNASRDVVDLFQTLGASPTVLAGNEWYVGMQTHLIDGVASTPGGYEAAKFYEVAKYLSLTNHIWVGCSMAANGYAWAALPPDIRAIVTRNAVQYTMLARQDAASDEQSVISRLQSRGAVTNTPDLASLRARLGPYYRRWKTSLGSNAWDLLEARVGKLG